MGLENYDKETISVNALENMCAKNKYLSAWTKKGDREPIWDGGIYVYNRNGKNNNNNFLGRVPVQIKSTETELKGKISVNMNDLRAYATEQGVMYIAVEISEDGEKIMYNSLTPLKLARILKSKGTQETVTISLYELPDSENDIASVFYSFLKNRSQTINLDLLSMHDMDGEEGHFKEFGFDIHLIDGNMDIWEAIAKGEIYLHATPDSKYGDPITYDLIERNDGYIAIEQEFPTSIKVGDKLYFDKCKLRFTLAEGYSLEILDSLKITQVSKDSKDIKLVVNYENNLDDLIEVISFINDSNKYGSYTVNEAVVFAKNIDEEITKYFLNQEEDFRCIKQRLIEWGLKDDISFKSLDKESISILKAIAEEKPLYSLTREINKGDSFYTVLKIGDKNICVCIVNLENTYRVFNYYDNKEFVSQGFEILDEETNEKITTSRFIMLNSNNFDDDNLSANSIIEDIKSELNFENEVQLEWLNEYLLESIHAYDRHKRKEVGDLMLGLALMLNNESPNDINYMNVVQCKLRLGLEITDSIKSILEIKERNPEDDFIQIGCDILLGNNSVEERIFKLKEQEREVFVGYPIYKLVKNIK